MSSIFNIQKEYFEIINKLEENEGEITEEISEMLSINENEFNDKLVNYIKMIYHIEGDLNTIENEVERLNKIKKSKEKVIYTLKENISVSLQSRSIDNLDLGTNKLSFRESSSVVISDENSIPKEFISEKVTKQIDKVSLKKWINEGNTTEGAYIQKSKNLQIK